EKITPQFIETLLKKWQKSDFSEEDLATLNYMPTESQSLEQSQLYLREMLYQRVQGKLSASFLKAVASQNRERVLVELKELFRTPPSDTQYFALIHSRYLALRKYTVDELATNCRISPRTLRRYLLKGFENFSIQIKAELDKNERNHTGKNLQDHFPTVPRNQVIGIDTILSEINHLLLNSDLSQAISIEGIGGIGKTFIAQHLLQEQYQKSSFEGYAWVSAIQKELSPFGEIASVDNFASTIDDIVARLAHQLGQSHLSGLSTQDKLDGLKKLFSQYHFLVIIDNLETLNDVDKLVPELLKIIGKSKFLFTSRKSLSQYPKLRTFRIPELSLEDSYTLVDREIKRIGLTLSLPYKTISSLYDVIGGIPLVLKLATAQFGFLPARSIIRQLRLGEENAQNMYSYIYRQAWDLLDDTGKRLLIAMLIVSPDGENREWICEINALRDEEFDQGLEQLKRLSLIEFLGTIEEPLYRIHRLTTTFLHTDILRGWGNNESS
ncbi:MAG: hypothetical protein HN335_04915, partial [Anaerolineae bacterium]|nr:hypothetical protein [Anaerolineae bacterium]